MRIPDGIRWLEREPTGPAWLSALPALVAELAAAWQLELGEPYEGASVSWVAPATGPSGCAAVLKVQWPHRECEHEATALAAWDGTGAVRLLAHDQERHALLLERCEPATTLAAADGVDPLGAFVALLPQLWVAPPAAVRTLAEEALEWAASLPGAWDRAGRPCEQRLVDAAVSQAHDLLASTPVGDHVLLHQDLHAENVLAARRSPWLAVDPKPLAGERALAAAPIVRDFDLGHDAPAVRRRLDRLSEELGLDRERVRGWSIVQTMAWSFDSRFSQRHHQTVAWLLDG